MRSRGRAAAAAAYSEIAGLPIPDWWALLTATSVVVSFLGARALTTSHLRGMAFLGLGVFVLSLVACLYVLVPARTIESLTQGGALLDLTFADPDPASDAYRRLTVTCDACAAADGPRTWSCEAFS